MQRLAVFRLQPIITIPTILLPTPATVSRIVGLFTLTPSRVETAAEEEVVEHILVFR